MTAAVRVGLAGAGPWARLFTAPLLAAGPDCALAAVWARRPDAASSLAARHEAIAASSFGELLESCDAVAFAVPPDVQAQLATRAAAAGRPVLLEKPVGPDLAAAMHLADVIATNGVVSQLVLTNRYRPSMRSFLDGAAASELVAGRATFLSGGAVPGSYFATPWRLEQGALPDLGPHVFDALDAALGPIVDVRAAGDPRRVVALTCHHQSGAVSQATVSTTTAAERSGLVVELFGPAGVQLLDTATADADDGGRDIRTAMAVIAREFAAAVRTGTSHALDVRRGVYLQQLIDDAGAQLAD
jgi:predicted dehydrogenase